MTEYISKPKKVKLQTQHVFTRCNVSNTTSSAPTYASITAAQPTSNSFDPMSRILNEFKTELRSLISLLIYRSLKLTTNVPYLSLIN